MLHNVADLTDVINQLVKEQHTITPELIQHLSPYMTEHIKRFGQYFLDVEDTPEPLKFDKLEIT